jgi:hypothetical protein
VTSPALTSRALTSPALTSPALTSPLTAAPPAVVSSAVVPSAVVPSAAGPMSLAAPVAAGARAVPAPVFDHLLRMTDDRGLFEHARYGTPRRDHGYCVDDVARGLVVTCREPDPTAAVSRLADLYLDFTLSALDDDGACHNRMGIDGVWQDAAGTGDWWGRAVWGLGVAAARGPSARFRARALAGFRSAARRRSVDVRALVFAGLGAGELLLAEAADARSAALESRAREPRSNPDLVVAAELLRDAVALIPAPGSVPGWRWPEARLRYGNGSLVEVLLLAGAVLTDPIALGAGLELLEVLLGVETRDGHLSVTPVGGRGPHEAGPGHGAAGFDQQPIEVAALADVCARAWELTGEDRWSVAVDLAWAWFDGDNDNGAVMFDAGTGAGYDGLEPEGRNENQGAESTLAMLSTAQHVRRVHLVRRTA